MRPTLTHGFPRLLLTAVFLALWPVFALWASADFTPKFNPTIDVSRSIGEIRIDGKIDEEAWTKAVRADNFVERSPGENTRPDVATEAFITYDNENLYVAFRCYDDPTTIRATMCQRDQFQNDDAVIFLLDTYGTSSWAYEFYVNPYGVQKDRLWSKIIGEDDGFDMVWNSAASIDDTGYNVEIAIPFAGLRFPNTDSQTWKVDFWRTHPRSSFKQYSWAAYNRNDQCWVCQWGTMNGINNVKPGKGLEILPSMIFNQASDMTRPWGPDAPIDKGKGSADFSVGAKYSISSTSTIEAAYNPDFSQIETDAAQIDVNTTIALFYPERRPFFQEGSDIFRTLFNSFYTRTVNDPQFAAKLTSRNGRYTVGAVTAYDENTPYMIPLEEGSIIINTGKSTVNVVRGTRDIGTNSHVGLIVTDRRFDGGGYGSILSFDGDIKLSQRYGIVGQYIYSLSKEPIDSLSIYSLGGFAFDNGKHTAALDGESYSGQAFITQFRRRARAWNFTVDYNQVAPSYRTQTGYDPWADYRNFSAYSSYNIYPSKGLVQQLTPNISWDNRWNFDNERKWQHFGAGFESSLSFAQTYFGLYFNQGREKWQGIVFKDLWNLHADLNSTPTPSFRYFVSANYGRGVAFGSLETGNETFLSANLIIKPVNRLIFEPAISYTQSRSTATDEMLYKQLITRGRIRFQFNRELTLRLFAQYNNRNDLLDIDPLLTYRIGSFSVFYIGSTHNINKLEDTVFGHEEWKETARQFFVKLQYLLRA